MTECIAHSKNIHAIHKLYGRSFPHRVMTYQVSYCIYTAATVDALEMKRSEASARVDAAKRLALAVQILQEEAKHTPGSGRSLDTIRQQLSQWNRRPTRKTRAQYTKGHSNTSAPGQRLPQTEFGSGSRYAGSAPVTSGAQIEDRQDDATAMQHLQSPMFYQQGTTMQYPSQDTMPGLLSGFQGAGPFGIGVLDTGAGFHPEAFPWDMIDNFDSSPQGYQILG